MYIIKHIVFDTKGDNHNLLYINANANLLISIPPK